MPTTMQGGMSSIKTDPVRNFKFLVNINHTVRDNVKGWGGINLARMGFMNMSGLAMTTEVIPYREGGNNTTQRKMPGQSNFSDITLSRGVVLGNGSKGPWAWTREIFSANLGDGTNDGTKDFRCDVVVYVLAHPVTESPNAKRPPAHVKFKIYNAWITGMAFSELDAGGNAVYVQQMTLAHEGFEMNFADKVAESVT